MVELSNYISAVLSPPKGIPFEKLAAFQLQASWSDVAAKAKRLVQSGAVTILRNTPTHVMSHVIGDHGEYNGEFSRTDPNSGTIEQWSCFLPDAPVTMADGTQKSISELQVGDEIVTHTGQVQPVTAVMSRRYRGGITRIKLRGIDEEVVATSNHRLWVANEDHYHVRRPGREGKYKPSGQDTRKGWLAGQRIVPEPWSPQAGWEEIGDLEPKMYLSAAATTRCVAAKFDNITIDDDLAYLLGWYAAEGFVIKSTTNRAGFSMHKDEWPIAERLSAICERVFGTPGTIRQATWPSEDRDWMTDFRISSPMLRRMVETLVGSGAKTKRLSREVMEWPITLQESFIQGWFEGDGTFDRAGNRRVIVTTSHDLANQLRLMVMRLGYSSSLSWSDNNDGDGFVQNWSRIYRVRWSPERQTERPERFFQDNNAWYQIEKVSREDYIGEVWDIEVAEDHSFQAYGINCHNCECPWNQFAFDRTRKWRVLEGRVCSHVLASYWKSKGTPLDMSDQDSGFTPPGGQKLGPSPGQQSIPGVTGQPPAPASVPYGQKGTEPVDLSQGGNQPPAPGPVLPSNTDLIQGQPPQPPYNYPKSQPSGPQLQQLQLFDITAPPGMQPTPQGSPVSVPGGRPPTPGSPVQFPGTFSHFIPIFTVRSNTFIYASDELSDYFEQQRTQGLPIYAALTSPVTLELRGGKIPIPGAQSVGTSSEGVPMYRVLDLGYNPQTGMRENANTNALMGAPEQTGTYADVPPNKQGEVIDYNPQLRMAYISVPLNYPGGEDARLHPHAAVGWVDYNSLRPLPNRTRSPVRRRRL